MFDPAVAVRTWPTVVVPLMVAFAMVGGVTYVNAFVRVADPPGVVITTFTTPAAFAGVTTVTEVALTTVTEVPEVPPKVIPEVPVRFVPVIVTVVPPEVVPLVTLREVIVGLATYVNAPDEVTVPP